MTYKGVMSKNYSPKLKNLNFYIMNKDQKSNALDILGVKKLNVLEQTSVRGGAANHHHHDTGNSHHHDTGNSHHHDVDSNEDIG